MVRLSRPVQRGACLSVILSTALALLTTSAMGQQNVPGGAALPTASVAGVVLEADGGLPIPNAVVELRRNGASAGRAVTDRHGAYGFGNQPNGVIYVVVRAQGYQTTRSDDSFVVGTGSVSIRTTMLRSTGSQSALREIGRVTAQSDRSGLQSSSTIQSNLSPVTLLAENYIRVGEALQGLPGVNLASTSSSVGDDLYVDIRGLTPDETETLLDGHPIGPYGVGGGGFNYQVSPMFALQNVKVTYGSGALGLYGTDAVGGSVDFQTLEPTANPAAYVQQGVGGYGRALTGVQATGTVGRFGYAIASAVEGTSGNFAPQTIHDTGGIGGDQTLLLPSNPLFPSYTYLKSQDYVLRNDLFKFRYAISPRTAFTATAYSAISWDDKSGNGDNDFNTYELQLYNARQAIAAANSSSSGAISATSSLGATYSCVGALPAFTFAHPSGTCLRQQQYATLFSGPAGGGPGPWQAIRNQDYHGRLTSQLGRNLVVADVFFDNYALDYNRSAAGGVNPQGTFFYGKGGFNSSFYRTTGFLISDDIATAKNDFGFGYYSQHQQETGDTFDFSVSPQIQPNPSFFFSNGNAFFRDAYSPSPRLSLVANAWVKSSSVTKATTFDPRASLVYRPDARDVVRLTGGKSDGEPRPDLLYSPYAFNSTPQNINPNCNGTTSVATASNPNLQRETAKDLELAIGHRLAGDSIVQVDLYRTLETNLIFQGVGDLPISQLGPNAIPAAALQQYFLRLRQACPQYSGYSDAQLLTVLSATTNFNAATARFQGVELNGRFRINQRVFLDYTYDVQSAVQNDVPTQILVNSPLTINGAQIAGIPLHKGSLGVDYADARGFEARIDTIYVDGNNSLHRPAYVYSNGFIQRTYGRTTLNLGVTNIFNQASDIYGRIGLGVFVPENAFGPDSNALQQQSERFGILPTQIMLTLKQHV
jgi:outer membrane receptor protein involved in Fe transport